MATVSTFGTFTMVKLGIYAASQGFSVTGNNISNINTTGYTRQAVDQTSMYCGGADRYTSENDVRIGSGVFVTGVSQLRNPYLDIQYRNSYTNVGATDAELGVLTRLQSIFDEVGDGEDGEGVVEAQLNRVIEQLENLVTQGAGVKEYDTLVQSSVSSLCTMLNDYSAQLQELYENVDAEFRQNVTQVNNILESITNLNEQIRIANVYGSDALELKDERNNLIDDLSYYMDINVSYEMEDIGAGKEVEKLVITVAGHDTQDDTNNNATLVDGIYHTQLSIAQEQATDADGNPLYETTTDEDGNEVLIPVMQDSSNYNLVLSPLKDKLGNTQILATTSKIYGENGTTYATKASAKASGDGFTSAEDAEEAKAELEAEAEQTEETRITYTTFKYTLTETSNITKATAAAQTFTDDEGNTTSATFNTKGEAQEVLEKYANTENYSVKQNVDDGTYSIYLKSDLNAYDTKKEAQAALDAMLDDKTIPPADAADNEEYTYSVVKSKGDWVIQCTKKTSTWFVKETTDTLSTKAELSDNTLYGALQSQREMLTEKGPYATEADMEADPNASTKYGIQYYQYAFDAFANKIAEIFNSANGCVQGEDGKWSVSTEYDTDYKPGILISNDRNKDDANGITAGNISVSLGWSTGATQIENSFTTTNSTANDNYSHLLSQMLTTEFEFKPSDTGHTDALLANTPYFTGKIQGMLTNINEQLANDTQVDERMLSNYETVNEDAWTQRDSVSGVDLNDEAMNMIMYQKAYQAACTLMTTFNEMIDKLINDM